MFQDAPLVGWSARLIFSKFLFKNCKLGSNGSESTNFFQQFIEAEVLYLCGRGFVREHDRIVHGAIIVHSNKGL
jgi:hypothetical protein